MNTDTIADYLTRIRNACLAKHKIVEIPASNTKKEITKILYDQGFTISGAIRFLKDDKNEKDHNRDDYTKANNLLNNAIYSLKKIKDIIKNY